MFQFSTNNEVPLHPHASDILISNGGNLTIIVYDNTIDGSEFRGRDGRIKRGTILASFLVSGDILCSTSKRFHEVYTAMGFSEASAVCAYLECDRKSIISLEIYLRAIHDEITDTMYSATVDETSRALDVALTFEARGSKLNFWFSHWLANKDLTHMNVDLLSGIARVCERFNHEWGLVCIKKLQKIDSHFPLAISNYPPVLIKSYRQHSAVIFHSKDVKPSEYQTAGYSAAFKLRYGNPTEYWSDFYRLMSTQTVYGLTPRIDSLNKLMKMRFLTFAANIDNSLKQKGRTETPVWRDAMEAMWAKKAIGLFDEEAKELGDGFQEVERIRIRMQLELRHALRQRFHPAGRVEAYWTEKAEKYGGEEYEIEKKDNGHDEPEGEMELEKPEMGDNKLDMAFLVETMAILHVRKEEKRANVEDITAEKAMVEAMRRLPKTKLIQNN